MWVLDLGTFEIHMDDKPPQCLTQNEPELESQQQQEEEEEDQCEPKHDPEQHERDMKRQPEQEQDEQEQREPKRDRSEEQQGNGTKPKRRRRVVDSSTTCAPEQVLCRYANKKCLNPRAVKRTGGLHTFCAMHRANANRNQRRLDMRKRLQKQALRAQQEGALTSVVTPTPRSRAAARRSPGPLITPAPVIDTDALYEPLSAPTPLQAEDISTLVTLFLPPSPEIVAASPASSATTSSPAFSSHWSIHTHRVHSDDWSPSSTSTQGTSPPSRGGMRY